MDDQYFESDEGQCPYLENEREIVSYKILINSSMEYYAKYVKRGWRRFGMLLHRPNCKNCFECINLRIDVRNYKFSKSAKRVLKKAENIKISISRPSVRETHIELYNKYHHFMSQKKGWNFNETTEYLYNKSFIESASTYGYEVLYYDEDKIIGIDFIDVIDDGISAIYFFYDPDYSHLSLGKLSIYYQIIKAKELGLKWIYMGYYVKDCDSLNYKSKYEPYQLLKDRPSIDEDDIWYFPKK